VRLLARSSVRPQGIRGTSRSEAYFGRGIFPGHLTSDSRSVTDAAEGLSEGGHNRLFSLWKSEKACDRDYGNLHCVRYAVR